MANWHNKDQRWRHLHLFNRYRSSGLRTVTDVTNYVIIIIIIILIIIMHIIFNKYDTVSLTLLFAEES